MGTVDSKLESTDWDAADGGMAGDAKCMAGQTPTHGRKDITMKKVEILNHRIFDVADAEGNVIFKFRPTNESFQWFELTSPHVKQTHPNKGEAQHLCRAAKVSGSKTLTENAKNYLVGDWTLYSYVRPAFEGQEGDEKGRMDNEFIKDKEAPLYRAYQVEFDNIGKSHALIHPFVADPEGKEKCGVPGDAILKLEKVKGMKEVYQVSLPDSDGLVAFWNWDNTLTEHKIKLKLAKGMDLALIGTLAMLVNVVKETEKFPFNVKSVFTS